MKQDSLISVIVPVYNTAQYLEECLRSIQKQTFKNLEILLVDDGSTDQSIDICMEFSRNDSRFKVFQKENGGAGSAKNYGLSHANGDYLMVVDSDDAIREDLIEVLYQLINESGADIAMGDYYVYNGIDQQFYFYVLEKDYKVELITPQEAIDRQLEGAVNPATYIVPWCKLYKRELFEDVRFPEGYKFDDEQTTHRLYLKSKKIAVVVDNLYMYRIGQPSEMRTTFTIQWVIDILRAFDIKIADCVLAGIDTTIVKQRFKNILIEYKSLMENYNLTNAIEYQTLLFRLELLEDN